MNPFLSSLLMLFTAGCVLSAHATPVYLNANTPVQLRTLDPFGTDSVTVGGQVKLETVLPIRSKGVTFISEQNPASANVVLNQNNGFNGEPARLILDQFTVQSSLGEDVRLRCRQDIRAERKRIPNVTAGGGVGVGGPVGVFLSLPILSLLIKGHEVNVPSGTEFTCYTLSELEMPL
jgi:hypothetical protein